jgi:hypothetical protein
MKPIRAQRSTARRRPVLVLAVALVAGLVAGGPAPLRAPSGATPAGDAGPAGSGSLVFVPNAGQSDPAVRFQAAGRAASLFFAADEVVVALPGDRPDAAARLLRVRFDGAGPRSLDGAARLPGVVNFLLGDDPAGWRTGLPAYGAVVYRELYGGIDLHYDGAGGQLESTFDVTPGADPGRIRWRYTGAESVRLDARGDLEIRLPGEPAAAVRERAPQAWQERAGQRVPVSASFDVAPDGTVGFALGAYDRSLALTIDPVIVFSTYLGGSIADQPWGLALDPQGNAYIAGYTASSNFPTLNAYQPNSGGQGDAFVSKFGPNGALIYSTYLGGNYIDYALAIAVDAQGSAYVVGWTGSSDFPVVNAYEPSYQGGWDGFVTKLAPSGQSLVYSTYLGGSGADNGAAIAVDAGGGAYVAGETQSTDFPLANAFQSQLGGSQDAFVTRLAPAGNALVYSSYLGGAFGGERGQGIAVNQAGEAHVTGFTTAGDFPTVNPFQGNLRGTWDVFVTKFSSAGNTLVYSTFLGGDDEEYVDIGQAIAVDAAGTAYVTGFTGSYFFPTLNAYQPFYGGQVDVFASKFDGAGQLLYSTFLGGDNSETGNAIAVDGAGRFYVAGLTISRNFPVVDPLQLSLRGFEDLFLTQFSADGATVSFSTYLGGGVSGREEYGATGVAVDSLGTIYVGGMSSTTDFPVVNAYQPGNMGSYDAVLVRIAGTALPTSTPGPTFTPSPTASATTTGTPTFTPTTTPTAGATASATDTATITPTAPPTSTPTATSTTAASLPRVYIPLAAWLP